MNYKEFVESVRQVPPPAGLELVTAILGLHMEYCPLGVLSLGEEVPGVVKVPDKAENRYGRTVSVVAVARKAFAGQERITDLVLPASVRILSAGTFAGCVNLRRITIPKKIRSIPADTFAGCTALEDIYYEGSPEEWKKIGIEGPAPDDPERRILSPGNETILFAALHFHCDPEEAYDPLRDVPKGRDVTQQFWERRRKKED